jgi:hypothetical protein
VQTTPCESPSLGPCRRWATPLYFASERGKKKKKKKERTSKVFFGLLGIRFVQQKVQDEIERFDGPASTEHSAGERKKKKKKSEGMTEQAPYAAREVLLGLK